MKAYLPSPIAPLPLLQRSDPILNGQIGWWMGNEGGGTKIYNLITNAFNGTLQAGATRITGIFGRTIAFDGGATAYVDLGTIALLSNTQPFTYMWVETVGASPTTYPGAACFMPSGATQRFLILRSSDTANYAPLSVGKGSSTPTRFTGAPTLAASVARRQVWIVTGAAGMNSTTAADYQLYVDDVSYAATTAGGAFSSQTGNFNYLGWDGADDKTKGNLDNCRLWTRVLKRSEIARLSVNPWAGIHVPAMRILGNLAADLFPVGYQHSQNIDTLLRM